MNHIFQTSWHGEALSPHEWLCLTPSVDHGHRLHLHRCDLEMAALPGVAAGTRAPAGVAPGMPLGR